MAYNTDLTDQQWCIISPLFPINKGRGHPPELDLQLVLNAILYLVRTGCQWRNLPNDFPKWQSVYYYFRKWSKDGSWQAINETLRKMEREKRGREPELLWIAKVLRRPKPVANAVLMAARIRMDANEM